MRNYFILNGVDSRDFGVYISGQGTFSAPQKAYQFYNIPGRNGALLGNEHRLENINISYEAFIYTNFDKNLAAFRSFLLSLNGYTRLTDSYHPDEFRLAVYTGPFEPTVKSKNDCGSFTIIFSCKPQRFLYDGETWYKWSGSYIYLNGEEISGQNNVDTSYMTLSRAVNFPTDDHPRPTRSVRISLLSYAIIKVGGVTKTAVQNADTAYTAIDYDLVAGTGSVKQKYIEAPKTGWTLSDTNTFRHSVSGVSSLVWCTHYSLDSSQVYRCWYENGYVYVHDPNHSTANSFMSWLNTANMWFCWNLTTAESISITAYSPDYVAPFMLEVYVGASTTNTVKASEYARENDIVGLRNFVYTSTANMENPTYFESQPLIRVYGNGKFTVNDIEITVTNATTYTDIDCEMMDCYEGSTNRNNDVSFSTYDFPVLKVGNNPVAIVSGITEVDIQPRWWRV